jgi:hypothetical protein
MLFLLLLKEEMPQAEEVWLVLHHNSDPIPAFPFSGEGATAQRFKSGLTSTPLSPHDQAMNQLSVIAVLSSAICPKAMWCVRLRIPFAAKWQHKMT